MKEMKKRLAAAFTAGVLLMTAGFQIPVFAGFSADRFVSAGESGFTYVHDPLEYPGITEDIVVDTSAIYGFSPNPSSDRLGEFASYDWTDPVVVSRARKDRIKYLEQDKVLYDIRLRLEHGGASAEEVARYVSAARNVLRLLAYDNDPEGLEKVKRSNLKTYGNENGPTAEFLYKKYGSWETVLNKAFSTNAGMDACLGLYDDNYPVYLAYGRLTPPQSDTAKLKKWGKNAPKAEIYYLNKAVYDNPQYYDQETGEVIWPVNDGFLGKPFEMTLVPGMKLDRYGSDYGTFTSLYGNPYEMYSCAPDSAYKPYSVFVVTKPFTARLGMVAPWFDQPGGATQAELPRPVKDLLSEGYLQRIQYR